ncbi:hypothetical protein OG585_48065 (plasmid) [Streptomyces sp. NBC_01340]|nr:group II intron reverse transcriptase/maturase [Streptomyces sp. NBC_01719]WSI44782.1 hypothetical protein OG585_48065 [Streptomyces sp. NBC_01340]
MRRSISSDGAVGTERLHDLERAAVRHGVPVEDVVLIAVNLYGITSDQDRHRARVNLRLARRPDVPWQIIVPLNQPASPFQLRGDELSLNGEVVAHVERIDADEAVGGYFRNDGRAATLNPNARSRCVGCGWCPNTLEAAADPRMQEDQGLDALLRALGEQHPRRSLAELTEVTVSTGCFEREEAAVAHLTALRPALERAGVKARIGFLTSVLRSDEAFETIASQVSPFVLRLTAEHFTRREALIKATKADLRPEQMPDLLTRAREAGLDTSYTYIVGLGQFFHDSDFTIVGKYGAEYRGFVQYYLLAQDVFRLNTLHWVMETSMLKTLAAKHRSTVPAMARAFKATISTPVGPRICFEAVVQRGTGRKPLIARFGGVPLIRKRTAVLTDRRPTMASPGNELIHRLLAGKCEICDAGKGLQVHHLRKLADLNRPGRPDRPPWMTLMAARRRKTLVVCSACHHNIHAGRGSALPRK